MEGPSFLLSQHARKHTRPRLQARDAQPCAVASPATPGEAFEILDSGMPTVISGLLKGQEEPFLPADVLGLSELVRVDVVPLSEYSSRASLAYSADSAAAASV